MTTSATSAATSVTSRSCSYSSLDWAVRDADGYFFILGRTDDVINVAGHRLGTREIEESVATLGAVAEVAVVGIADELKGQVPAVFATLKQGVTDDPRDVAQAMERRVVELLGGVARPACVYVVGALPKDPLGQAPAPRAAGADAGHRPRRPLHPGRSGRPGGNPPGHRPWPALRAEAGLSEAIPTRPARGSRFSGVRAAAG